MNEIDEKTYLSGILLSESPFLCGNPKSVEKYEALRATPPRKNPTGDMTTFLGAMQSLSDDLSASRDRQDQIAEALSNLYKDILHLIHTGGLVSYGYVLPRRLSDRPIAIPIDMILSGNLNWNNSELIYKNFQFTGIRLISPLKTFAQNAPREIIDSKNNQGNANSHKETPKEFSSKEHKKQNSNIPITELNPELHIDEKKAATYLGISHRTLQGYRTKGGGPEFIKISHKVVRYKIADLIKWTENKKRKNTSNEK